MKNKMEDALDGMLDIITGKVAYATPALNDNIATAEEITIEASNERAAIDELLGIHPAVVNIEPRPIMIEVYPIDQDSNMVNPLVRDEFRNETIFRETEIFTAPQITTITMEGFLLNVNCHEEKLIEDLEADSEFVRIKCNFGEKIYPHYQPPVKVKKSNRGRKKKPPKERKRKRQGTGECFNSQTTFVMPSSKTVVLDNGTVPTDAIIYKFKVFRTGKIQLPGLRTTAVIDDVMELTSRLVSLLNFHLHTCEDDITKTTKLINLNPVMKNYKFRTKMPDKWIIDLAELRTILHASRTHEGECPKIFDIKYTRQETKLSVRFSTPSPSNIKKRVRVNIFQSGKINILGGHTKVTTDRICEFIHDIFINNKRKIFTKLGCADEPLIDNIRILEEPIEDIVPAPVITVTEGECQSIIDLIDEWYEKTIADADKELILACSHFFTT